MNVFGFIYNTQRRKFILGGKRRGKKKKKEKKIFEGFICPGR